MNILKIALITSLIVLSGCVTKYKGVFDHQETRSNWCGCCLLETKYGLFATVYNNDSRKNSEVYLDWKKIYSGGQETIGQGLEYGNAVYFPAEGKGLIYENGKIRETVDLRWSSVAIVYKGRPCFVSLQKPEVYVIDAENGTKVLKLKIEATTGIPLAAAKMPNSEEYIIVFADNRGNEQLITTDGISIPLPLATAIVNWNGEIYAGAAGVIYKVDVNKKSVKKYKNTGSQMINHLWYDSENSLLWVGCSANDKIMTIDSFGQSYTVSEFTDDLKPKYFDTRITKDWFHRNQQARAQWYRIEKK